MFKPRIAASAALALILASSPILRAAQPPVPVIELSGTGPEMGKQQGEKLHQPIQFLVQHYLRPYFADPKQRFLAMAAALMFESHLLPEHLAEVKALAHATGLDEREAMLAQCFLDLSPAQGCSTIALPASAAPDHVARFGRNLDFYSKGVADKKSILMIFRPAGKYQFAAISWPGMIGVLSGMNQWGLSLANMEVDRPQRLPQAMPYTLLYRTLLEQCKTVQEAIDLLEKTPRQSANNLMLMDAAGDRAVVEIRPESISIRRASDTSALISTNHQRGQDQNSPGKCDRYDHLHDQAAADFGKIDLLAVENMLKTVGQGDFTMQSMVFEPSNRVIYLSTGLAAQHGPFLPIDLKPYFDPPPKPE